MKVYETVNDHVNHEELVDGVYWYGDGESDTMYATRPFTHPDHPNRYLVNVHGGAFGPDTHAFSSLTVASKYRDQFDNWDRLTARVKSSV